MRPKVTCLSLLPHLEALDELAIKHVAEGSMAEVMHQASDRHIADFAVRNLQVRLGIPENRHLLSCQVRDTNTVLKSAMAARGEHLIAEAELLEVLKALKGGSVNDLPAKQATQNWLKSRNKKRQECA